MRANATIRKGYVRRALPTGRGESDFPFTDKSGAESGNIAGIGRYFRLIKDDVQWSFHKSAQ